MSRSVRPASVFLFLVLVTALAPACTSILGDYHVVGGEGGAGGETSASSSLPDFTTTITTTTGSSGHSGPGGTSGNSGPGSSAASSSAVSSSSTGTATSSASGGGLCADGAQGGNETDIDCGGDCPPCPDGSWCGNLDVNCQSNNCYQDFCVQVGSTCANGVQDFLETDVDCGSAVCPGCAIGKQCEVDDDCASHHCSTSRKRCIL